MNKELKDIDHLLDFLTPRGGAYEGSGDARRKFWIKPLKETNLGLA